MATLVFTVRVWAGVRAPDSSFLATPKGPDGVLHLPQGKSDGSDGGPRIPGHVSTLEGVGSSSSGVSKKMNQGLRTPPTQRSRPSDQATGVASKMRTGGPPPPGPLENFSNRAEKRGRRLLSQDTGGPRCVWA